MKQTTQTGRWMSWCAMSAACIGVQTAHAQSGAQQVWATSPSDVIKAAPESNRLLQVDSGANAYRASQISAGSSTAIKVWKYNSTGAEVSSMTWIDSSLGGSGVHYPMSVSLRESVIGVDVVVTGTAPGQNGQDYITIKYTTDTGTGVLTQQWAVRYNNAEQNGDDIAVDCSIDSLGNVYVTGSSAGLGTSTDYLTLKYNSGGTEQWKKRYGPAYADAPADMDIQESGSAEAPGTAIIITGSSSNGVDQDYATIGYDQSGNLLWSPPAAASGAVRFNGGGADFATSLDIFGGYVYVTGASYRSATNLDYCTIAYYLNNGTTAWGPKFYNGSMSEPAKDIPHKIIGTKGPSAGEPEVVYVTGEAWGGAANKYDYATLQYHAYTGSETWLLPNILNISGGEDRAMDMFVQEEGDCYVTGVSFNGTTLDYRTRRIDAIAGGNTWTMSAGSIAYDGGSTDTGLCVRLRNGTLSSDTQPRFWITGRSSTLTGAKPITLKYCQCGSLPCAACD